MCSFCRYSKWEGDCSTPDVSCKHALSEYKGFPADELLDCDGIGVDCWGFRPRFSPEFAADMVGLWLQGKDVDWERTNCENT